MSAPHKRSQRLRLDELLVQRGLVDSRSLAKGLILSGKVRSGTVVLDKVGKEVPVDIALEILQPPRYVSRGGEKLEGYLSAYPLAVSGYRVLDVGASTGGFTDCCLQNGAEHVTCVDVGYGQLHAKLREDPRITNLEKVNARNLAEVSLPFVEYDLVVMDLSFISLRLILPAVWPKVRVGGHLIALVKPQFEAGKKEVDQGRGVIRDPLIRARVLAEIRGFIAGNLPSAAEVGCVESPIHGADGNLEYLLGITKVAEI